MTLYITFALLGNIAWDALSSNCQFIKLNFSSDQKPDQILIRTNTMSFFHTHEYHKANKDVAGNKQTEQVTEKILWKEQSSLVGIGVS